MQNSTSKEKKIERIIELAYDSLKSHFPYTRIKTTEGKDFHKKAIQEYAEIIKLTSELY